MIGELDGVKIVALVNNSPKYDSYLKGCFGLSLWIEARLGDETKNILFDVGPLAEPLLYNAERMHLAMPDVEMIVLSHCHFDHTAALAGVISAIGHEVPVFAHPDIFRPNFALLPQFMNYGMVGENRRERLEDRGAYFVLTRSPIEPVPGVLLTGEVERITDYEEAGGVVCQTVDARGTLVPDDLLDDISLVLKVRDRGLIILTGCAHAGVINIVKHAIKVSGVDRVEGVIGGFHLLEAGSDRVDKTVSGLQVFDPAWVAPMHCTGIVPSAKIAMAMPGRYIEVNAGDVVYCP